MLNIPQRNSILFFEADRFDPVFTISLQEAKLPILEEDSASSLITVYDDCVEWALKKANPRQPLLGGGNGSLACCPNPGFPTWPPPSGLRPPFGGYGQHNDPSTLGGKKPPPYIPTGQGGWPRPTGVGGDGKLIPGGLQPPDPRYPGEYVNPDLTWPIGSKSPFQQRYDDCKKANSFGTVKSDEECLAEAQKLYDTWNNPKGPRTTTTVGGVTVGANSECCRKGILDYFKYLDECFKARTGTEK